MELNGSAAVAAVAAASAAEAAGSVTISSNLDNSEEAVK